jgi:DNA invertase Pin-like site-specific DNA recombinase
MNKRAAIYARTSTLDQHTQNQIYDLQQLARQRGLEVVKVYEDQISGTRARRPGLDQLMTDARQGKFDVLLVWAADRLARSVSHFLQVLDELQHLGVEFASYRESIDTGGPLGRAVVVIVAAIAELERNLIVERVKSGMRRARLEGRRLGRPTLAVDRAGLRRDRERGLSLAKLAALHHVSKTSVSRILNEAHRGVPKSPAQPPRQMTESTRAESLLQAVP